MINNLVLQLRHFSCRNQQPRIICWYLYSDESVLWRFLALTRSAHGCVQVSGGRVYLLHFEDFFLHKLGNLPWNSVIWLLSPKVMPGLGLFFSCHIKKFLFVSNLFDSLLVISTWCQWLECWVSSLGNIQQTTFLGAPLGVEYQED